MAHEYTSWAYAQEIPGAGRKFVLVALADRANADGYSFPGQKGLASMTGQSERTVREHLEWLEAEGFICREERRRKDGTRTSDAYYLPPMDSTGNIRRLTSSGEIRRLNESTKPPVQDEQYPPAATGNIRRLSEPRSTGRFRRGHRQISPVDDNSTFVPSSTTQTPDYQPADFAGHESFNHQKEPSLTPLTPQGGQVANLATSKPAGQPPDPSKRSKTEPPFDPLAMTLPASVPLAAWADFVAHRIEMRKPLKPTGAKTLLKQLAALPDAAERLTLAVSNGWQGVLFHGDRPTNTPPPRKKPTRLRPVQDGDILQHDRTNDVATVMEVLPGQLVRMSNGETWNPEECTRCNN